MWQVDTEAVRSQDLCSLISGAAKRRGSIKQGLSLIGCLCSQYGRGGQVLFQICFKFNSWQFGVARRKFALVLLGMFSR